MSISVIEIWTDGACKGNPGPGGWGVFIRSDFYEKDLYGGEIFTTNNRMELLAVIKGLSTLEKTCHVIVYTDSLYVMKGITEWLDNWKKRGWRTVSKKTVKNFELWKELEDQVNRHNVQWRWVKGHTGIMGNERADKLANIGMNKSIDI